MYLCYKKLVSTIGLLLTLTACGGGGGSTLALLQRQLIFLMGRYRLYRDL